MIWVHLYEFDESNRELRPLLICPANDAHLWGLLECGYYFRYLLIEEAP